MFICVSVDNIPHVIHIILDEEAIDDVPCITRTSSKKKGVEGIKNIMKIGNEISLEI